MPSPSLLCKPVSHTRDLGPAEAGRVDGEDPARHHREGARRREGWVAVSDRSHAVPAEREAFRGLSQANVTSVHGHATRNKGELPRV